MHFVLFAEKDPTKKLELFGYAKKLAHRHAFENAFKRVIIVSLDNGKVGVEINQQDIAECSLDELREDGILHVNYIEQMPCSDTDEDEEMQLQPQNSRSSSFPFEEVVSSWLQPSFFHFT